jgi:hypothetical protein
VDGGAQVDFSRWEVDFLVHLQAFLHRLSVFVSGQVDGVGLIDRVQAGTVPVVSESDEFDGGVVDPVG